MEEPMTEQEINERFTAKVRRGVFRPVARHLTNLAEAEDRLSDAIAQVWWMYRCYAVERGQAHFLDDPLSLPRFCGQPS
jgi:hypothetical protein